MLKGNYAMTQNIVEPPKNGRPELTQRPQESIPPVDIYENELELLILADLPRVTTESLSVEVNHPELKIVGRVPSADQHGEIVYARTFRLDASMDAAKIRARISGGVLEVHLPKSEPYRVRKIEVTGS
jgi:HSP20 family molecular chaperone IbpA